VHWWQLEKDIFYLVVLQKWTHIIRAMGVRWVYAQGNGSHVATNEEIFTPWVHVVVNLIFRPVLSNHSQAVYWYAWS